MTSRPDILDDSGTPIPLGAKLSESGEATLYRHGGQDGHLIKLHHRTDAAQRRKLERVVSHRPEDPSLDPDHRNFAWPLETVRNMRGDAVGVILPEVADARSLTVLANPKLRVRHAAEMNLHFLHAVAANIAFLFDCLHDQGFIVGDIRPENILIDKRARVTLIDCDSIQFRDTDGTVHLCPVGTEGFTAPEWIGRRFDSGPRTDSADRFGLAVLLYQLLTGSHPWTGEWMGGGEPPPRDHLIRSGDWPYRAGAKLRPIPGLPGPDTLSPELADLFRQAFVAGATDPDRRPSPSDWQAAACLALADLETCAANSNHLYDVSIDTCPWCARVHHGLPDIFPPAKGQTDPFAALILAFDRAMARGDSRMARDLWHGNPVLQRRAELHSLHSRLAEMDAALTALDQWRIAQNNGDTGMLASLSGMLPLLSDSSFFRHEADHDPIAIRRSIEAADDATLSIPPIPARPILSESVSVPPASQPVRTEAASVRRMPPMQAREGTQHAITLSYRISPGWSGLRPPSLIVSVSRPARIPPLTLIDTETGHVLCSIAAMRIRGETAIPLDHPAQRVLAELIVPNLEHIQINEYICIAHPPKRQRYLGPAAGSLLRPAFLAP
ncbi:hypothetical protein HH303_08025 [Rhodospirillaceae bacterium KN72]|uniref:Protein kinase domain-containing protein n=1 Tax=Pacificispira spongiicola TaxID=2729598 RepID=A0A7Y0HFC1_9PROT|nr:hypothetical protein [Pacificispira spongiicola]NMM44423.1 hypothetical protein [Pacificispira spongiicola]